LNNSSLEKEVVNVEDHRLHAAYLRVSTVDQVEKGLLSQMMAIKDHFKRNGITNFKIYQDEGVSGAKASRPALDEMLEEVKNGKIKSITAFSFSRISRSCSHLLKLLELCNEYDCQLVSITEAIDSKTHMGKLLMTLIGAIAEMERAMLRERVLAGIERARREGKVTFGRPKTRPEKLLRQLIAKNLTYKECARISGASQGSVSLVAKAMKMELAKEKGLPESDYKKISIDEVREHFSQEYPSITKNKVQNFVKQDSRDNEISNESLENNNDFEFEDISDMPTLEIERY
jgi:DNA invertase Pin-like site-specific DNA recombinase